MEQTNPKQIRTYWRVEGSLLELSTVQPVAFFTWNAQTFAERWVRRGLVLLMAGLRPFLYAGNRVFATRVVHTVLRGDEVLELCRLTRPDVVIADVNMPGMSGFAIARELHERHGAIAPLLIAYRLRLISFKTIGQLLSLMPGEFGLRVRGSWYQATLESCGSANDQNEGFCVPVDEINPLQRVGEPSVRTLTNVFADCDHSRTTDPSGDYIE